MHSLQETATLHEIKHLRQVGFIPRLRRVAAGEARGLSRWPGSAQDTPPPQGRWGTDRAQLLCDKTYNRGKYPHYFLFLANGSWTLLEEQDHTLENPFLSLVSRVLSNKYLKFPTTQKLFIRDQK